MSRFRAKIVEIAKLVPLPDERKAALVQVEARFRTEWETVPIEARAALREHHRHFEAAGVPELSAIKRIRRDAFEREFQVSIIDGRVCPPRPSVTLSIFLESLIREVNTWFETSAHGTGQGGCATCDAAMLFRRTNAMRKGM